MHTYIHTYVQTYRFTQPIVTPLQQTVPCGNLEREREREREHFVAINGSIVNAFVMLLVVEVIGAGCS